MACAAGPDISENGLVLALDVGNSKGYDNDENLVTDNATDFNYSFNNQIIPTANDVTPDGTTVLCKHDLTGATSPFLNCRANLTLTAGTYTMSMYLKGTTSFSGSFAFVGETTSEIYSNTANITTTWQRFTLTFTLIATQTLSRLQLFFATQGEGKIVSVLKTQLERGSVATDYTTRSSGTAKNRGTTWTDLSGRGNTGTLTNGPTYSSANGGSLVFDGVDDYINIPFNASTMDFSLAQTICMWIKPITGSNTARRNPYNQAYGGSGTLTYEINQTITYYFGTNGGDGLPYSEVSSGFTIAANELVFISVTRDQATNSCKWYKNAQLFTNGTAGGYASTANGTSSILIGDGYVSGFLGNIYDCKVYNRALTAQEIQQNFIATKGRYGI
jgi:hypothetical protein